MIAVQTAQRRERFSAVMRHVQRQPKRVDGLVVLRIDTNLAEHPTVRTRVPRHERVRLRDFSPGCSLVVRAVNLRGLDPRLEHRPLVGVALSFARRSSRLVAVDERVEHVRARPRDVDADPSAILRHREPGGRLRPAVAAVGGLPHPAFAVTGLNARIAPLAPDPLPRGRVERVRIRGIHHEIDCAGPRAAIQHLLPGASAVGRLEHAAVLVVGPLVSGCRDVHGVGV